MILLPGPDVLFVLAQSLGVGYKRGIISAAGFALGNFIHISAVAIGLSAIIIATPWAFSAIKIMGAMYLLYLAYSGFREKVEDADNTETLVDASKSEFKLFIQALTMNALNPKIAIFFLAFFPKFLGEASDRSWMDIFALGSIFVALAFVIFSIMAMLASFLSKGLKSKSSRNIIRYVKSIVMFILAVYLLIA
jgi:threonine/homoserine/homoserine lactone efflux protein